MYVSVKGKEETITHYDVTGKSQSEIMRVFEGKLVISPFLESYAAGRDVQAKLKKQLEVAKKQQETAQTTKIYYFESKSGLQIDKSLVGVHGEVSTDSSPKTKVGTAHCQGIRPDMEDAHLVTSIEIKVGGWIVARLFGVFDGHGDKGFVSQFIADNLPKRLQDNIQRIAEEKGKTELTDEVITDEVITDEVITDALTASFVQLNEELHSEENDSDTRKLKNAKKHANNGGTTATCALVIGNKAYVPNIGDSRTVLVKKGGTTIQLSEDAKPSHKRFEKAILKAGGFINMNRVLGRLAVARDLGMKFFKETVSPRPKITRIDIEDGDSLVLACDGLFDVASTDDVGRAVRKMTDSDPAQIASSLVIKAINAGSQDNVSCVVAKF